jgi:raffinose/stachyose/melibiose transport system permease protein
MSGTHGRRGGAASGLSVVDRTASPPPAATSADGQPVRRRRRARGGWVTITLFLLPALVLFGLLVLVPMLLAMYTSLYDWNGLGGRPTDFIGLENFQRLLTDDIFVGDLRRGGLLIILSLLIQLPLSLGIAMLLNQKLRGRGFYRLLFFVPYVLSEVITGALFTMVFSPNRGLANHIMGWFGFGDVGSTWLSDPNTVMYSLFFVMTWKYFGFHMILYLAGRQSIPNELLEAAAVDGAGSWQVFRHVTLPLLGPTIRISIFLSVIGTIQLFDLVWVLTGGGPLHASETLAVTMFNDGFRRSDVGYASATSIVMLLISLVFALGYQRFIMRRDIEGAVTVMQDKR